ncbi:MAG: EpsG family protein, partial [Sphingomonas sp.]
MLLYWSMFLVLTLGAVLNQEDEARRSRVLFILFASIPSILMIGLRWRIGPDWDNYHEIYNYSRLFSWSQALFHSDPGFSTLDLLLSQNSAPYWVQNLICGFVFIAGLTAFCLRQPNPWLAFLVAFPYLVIVIGMSGARQSIALGFLFFALNAFERDRIYRGAILIVAGALFHGSVILMLPICLLSYARNTVQRLVLLVASALLYFYVFRDTFSVYAHRYSSERIQSAGLAYRLAMNGLAAVLFLIFRRRLGFDEHDSKLWRNISLCTLALIP